MSDTESVVAEPVVEQAQVTETKVKAKASTKTGDFILDAAGVVEPLTKTKALNLADKLYEDIENNSFVLGGCLQVIFDQGWYEGYASFGDFVSERYGFQERKARYLMDIYTKLVKAQIPWSKVQVLGWTKLKDLATHLTAENVDEWVEKAKNLTVKELQALLKGPEAGGESGKTTSEFTKITFKLKPDQLETVQSALQKGKAELSTEFDSVSLENICSGYLAGSVGAAPQKDLKTLMQEAGWESVLNIFAEIYPQIDLEVKMPAT